MSLTRLQIAIVAHEANRAYCAQLGDFTQNPWEQAPDWQKYSAIAGVEAIAEGRVTAPDQSHASWMAQKERDGWQFGEVKNEFLKTHPSMVPFDQLPDDQRLKDVLFFGLVTSLVDAQKIVPFTPAVVPDTLAAASPIAT